MKKYNLVLKNTLGMNTPMKRMMFTLALLFLFVVATPVTVWAMHSFQSAPVTKTTVQELAKYSEVEKIVAVSSYINKGKTVYVVETKKPFNNDTLNVVYEKNGLPAVYNFADMTQKEQDYYLAAAK